MTYYLLLSGDSEKDSIYETNVLGEESFGTFYTSRHKTNYCAIGRVDYSKLHGYAKVSKEETVEEGYWN